MRYSEILRKEWKSVSDLHVLKVGALEAIKADPGYFDDLVNVEDDVRRSILETRGYMAADERLFGFEFCKTLWKGDWLVSESEACSGRRMEWVALRTELLLSRMNEDVRHEHLMERASALCSELKMLDERRRCHDKQ
jgi:hypothetical protein